MSESYKDAFNVVGGISAAGVSLFGAFALAATTFSPAEASLEAQVDDILLNMGQSEYLEALNEIPTDNTLAEFGAYFDESVIDDDVANLIFDAQSEAINNIDLRSGEFLTLGDIVPSVSPVVFAKYCGEYVKDCTRTNEEEVVATMDQLEAMKEFNREYFSNFIYASSLETHRVLDHWSPAAQLDDIHQNRSDLRIGKCVQYSLGIANEGSESFGIDRSTMSMMVVDPNDNSGLLHSVLVMRTMEGDYILDNNGETELASKYLVQQNYTPLQMQSFHDKTVWHTAIMTPVGELATTQLLPDPLDVGDGPRPDPRRNNNVFSP